MTDLTNPLIAALEPLLLRVRTTDTWVKHKGKTPWHTSEPLTDELLAQHLNGGPARGVCSMWPGSHVTCVGVLDLDNHKGESTWAEMARAAYRIFDALEMAWGARPVVFRSTGGKGIHIYVIWPLGAPQDARSVQQWFADVLAPLGLRSGVGGVASGVVEVNPKNWRIAAVGTGGPKRTGETGNMVVLPLAGNSEWLVADETQQAMVPADRDLHASDWRDSPPVALRERATRSNCGVAPDWRPDAPWALALDALAAHDGAREKLSGRDLWADCLFGLHYEASGSEAGREKAHAWSADLPGDYAAQTVDTLWDSLSTDGDGGRVITGGTIMKLARDLAGWVKPIEAGDDFGPVTEPVRLAVSAPALRFPPVDDNPDFEREKSGVIKPTMGNTVRALRVPRMAGMRLAWDEFRAEMVAGPSEGDGLDGWRPMDDADLVRMRIRLETAGFKAAGKEQVKDAVVLIAAENRFDSAQLWLRGVMARWDGVARVEGSMMAYFGCADSAYARAVGRYVWTALAGRVLDPGCKADMAVIFAGTQGLRKTSAIEAIAPDPAFFVEVDLGEDEEKTVRKIRGALVAELAELSGLSTRALGDIKKYLSRRHEKWVPKYKEFPATYPRRVVHFGTTNELEVLADDTGERRWLPLEATRMDAEGIARDREQLWAEGALMFAGQVAGTGAGVAWQDAEALARSEGVHEAFTVDDPWAERIAAWLAAPDGLDGGVGGRGASHFAMCDLLTGALGFATRDQSMAVQKRAGAVLKRIGYRKIVTWVDGRRAKRWTKV